MDSMALNARLKDFYGLKPEQTLQEFVKEIKSLTADDRAWFVAQFNARGLPTHDTKTA